MKNLVGVSSMHQQVSASKNLDISFEKLFFKSKITNPDSSKIVVNHECILDLYMEDILKVCKTVTMSDKEYEDYRYQPKKFCFDMYGITELWFLILKINNMVSTLEFDRKTLRVFSPDITKVINEIMILEEERYNENYNRNVLGLTTF